MSASAESTMTIVHLRPHRAATLASPWPAALSTTLGLGIAVVGLSRTNEHDITGLGLISALDAWYFVGLAAVLLGAVAEMMSPAHRKWWFAGHLVAVAFLLHGVTGIVEANPRFPTAYLHVGFTDQIADNGTLLQGLDARFNWPGFFAGTALVQQATGGAPLMWALRFFPLVTNLVMVTGVDVLGRAAHVSLHRRRAAQLLFLACNWIGQDYFSPQATASVLYLVSVLLVVTTFPGSGLSDRWRHRVGAGRWRSPPRVSLPHRLAAMAVLVLITAAMVTGHQITPGFLAISLFLLALTGVSSLRAYPFVIAVATVGWLSFAAEPYWTGHLQKLTGSAGRVSSIVQQNVTERAASGSLDRSLVVHTRLGFTALIVLAAMVSIYLLRRQRRLPLLAACLVAAPWPLLLLQAYGGEMAMRAMLVSLPALSLLASATLLPARARVRWPHLLALALVLAGLVPALLVARYGNEKYERISSDDLAVLHDLYYQEHGTALVMTANSKGPRFLDRVNEVRFVSLSSSLPSDIVAETEHRQGYASRFVFLGESQDGLGVELKGLRPGWTLRLARQLVGTGRFTVAAQHGHSVLLRLLPQPPAGG